MTPPPDDIRFASLQLDASRIPETTIRIVIRDLMALARYQRAIMTSNSGLVQVVPPAFRVLPSEVCVHLQQAVESWTFDGFSWQKAAGLRTLSLMTFYVLELNDVIGYFDFHRVRLMRFLLSIEDGYPNNPYHNRTHASDVVRVMNMLFLKGGILDTCDSRCNESGGGDAAGGGSSLGNICPPLLTRRNTSGRVSRDNSSDIESPHVSRAGSAERTNSVSSASFLPPMPPVEDDEKLGSCDRGMRKRRASRFHFGPLEYFAAIYAAVSHDHEHLGRNNDFLIRTRHEYALTYNDISPLEQHHVASSFRVLTTSWISDANMTADGLPCCPLPRDTTAGGDEDLALTSDEETDDGDDGELGGAKVPPRAASVPNSARRSRNFLCRMESDDYVRFREYVIAMVLATDMKNHFQTLSQFEQSVRAAEQTAELEDAVSVAESTKTTESVPEKSTAETILKLAIKIADVGHLTAERSVHERWVACLEEEMFLQGDSERARGMAVSPLMDRSKPGISRSQMGFFDVVVFPLFRAWVHAFPESAPLLANLSENYEVWRVRETGEGKGT